MPNSSSEKQYPRFIVSGLCGGSGKTLLALGLARAFAGRGLKVKPYKKGPDYIDAAWLALAAGAPATNLDLFFLSGDRTRDLFVHSFAEADLAVIEGNRGLFDGRDLEGSCSTAALAVILATPVVLALNCAKMTRTAAAVVRGLLDFPPKVNLAGVVLNNTGTQRHASIVRRSIEAYTPVPVLGALPRLRANPIPERHMGLTALPLFSCGKKADAGAEQGVEAGLDMLAALARDNVDLDAIMALALSAENPVGTAPFWPAPRHAALRPRLAFARDAALWFYYPENLEALERAGADLLEVSLLDHAPWPEIDGLYLGGGFPEDAAEALAKSPHIARIRRFSLEGMPVYAECGGFMILCEKLVVGNKRHTMAGVFPGQAVFHDRPQGLGYVEALAEGANPFHPAGTVLRGHEFHFSGYKAAEEAEHVLRLAQGAGMGGGRDGLALRNTYAGYTHIFAPSAPHWADNFVDLAKFYCQHKIKRL